LALCSSMLGIAAGITLLARRLPLGYSDCPRGLESYSPFDADSLAGVRVRFNVYG
jgi:hypothetical protein